MKILDIEKKYPEFCFQNLNQSNIKTLCANKDVNAIVIKRYKNHAWLYLYDCAFLVGVSKTYTNDQADKFYEKMKNTYGV